MREGGGGCGGARPAPIKRIGSMANIRDLRDPANELPDGHFRFRTRDVAVAPFVIVDQAAMTYAILGGLGGRRINLWFFGVTKWWPLERYWAI